MRYRTRTETYTVPHTVDGITVQVPRTREITEPMPPRDWDAIMLRVGVLIVIGLTSASVIWSTTSIAHLLGGTTVAYLAGAVFDLAWIAAGILAYLARHQPDRRQTADRVGWALLAVTVTAIGLEGWHTGGLAVAAVGAAVSAVAKGLWWTLDSIVRPRLTADDAQWVAAQDSAAQAVLAVAGVRRRAARARARAADELAAMEAARRLALPAGPPAVPDPTPALDPGSTRPDPGPSGGVDPTAEAEPSPAPEPAAATPTPRSTPASRPAGRPALRAVPDEVDPDELARARAIVAELRETGPAPSTEQIRKRMGIGRDRARALWLAIQAEEADPSRRTA